MINAVGRSRAVVEYTMDGRILNGNENFLKLLGYRLEEIRDLHYGSLLDANDRRSTETRLLWEGLNRGDFFSGQYKLIHKDSRPVWIQATYNPVFDGDGKPYKVAVFASDITVSKQMGADYQSMMEAVSKSQAMIEYELDGTILNANENFLNLISFKLDEIKGKHHRIFVEEAEANSPQYRELWNDLNRGTYRFGEYKRVAKGGRIVWLQASYNPVFDMSGKVYKIVKFGSDMTRQAVERQEAQALQAQVQAAAVERQAKIDSLLAVVAAAADGDLTKPIEVHGTDVAGQMADGLNRLLTDLRRNIAGIRQTATGVASSSQELSAISQQVSNSSQQSANQVGEASSASDRVSSNVSIVAASTDEMLASIREISKNASDAARVTRTAVSIADGTTQTISKLGISSQEIGKVVKVITSIAQQTNLLALNATIEAARAGEAGKGFAVVANEVKELAKETARATEEISSKIDAIQNDTRAAITAIADVSEIINQVNDISNTIASAVEEQTATTNEIGRNVTDAARGTSAIAESIRHVAKSTDETTAAARGIEEAAHTLTDMSAQLAALVGRFRL